MSIGDEKDKRLYCDKHGLYKTKLANGGFECVGCLREEIAENEDTEDTEESIWNTFKRYISDRFFVNVILIPLMCGIAIAIYLSAHTMAGITMAIILTFQVLYRITIAIEDIAETLG